MPNFLYSAGKDRIVRAMSMPSLQEMIQRHGLHAKKSLGQHFLLDRNITEKIVRLSGDVEGCHLVEVGPGPGGLTRAILHVAEGKASRLTVIEMDERAIPLLEELKGHGTLPLEILQGDALKVSLPESITSPRAVIANLPYNVGTEMLIQWLHDIEKDVQSYRFLTLMFQKEVVERLTASPGTKVYGRLSVLTQWLCEADTLFILPPSAFSPPPKVDSAVVRIVPKQDRMPCNVKQLERVTGAAFGQRRKMLRASLKSLGVDTEALLAEVGIEPTLRAERLSVEQFVQLANVLERFNKAT